MVSSGVKVELLLLQAVPGGSGGEAKEDAGMTREEVQEQVTSILTSKLTAHIVQVSSDLNIGLSLAQMISLTTSHWIK